MRALGLADESRQIAETRFGFDPVAAARVGDDAYLSGLWQSYRYFETIELELRQDFQFAVPLGGAAAALARDIDHSMSVCVHVRRTDFLRQGPKSPIAFVGTGYYRRGAERILDEYPSARFFVFSDDLDWCRQHLDFIPNPIFVGKNLAGYKDSAHLQLMSRCKLFLIANSTFSWWAAWLAGKSARAVYLPRPWFTDQTVDTTGFYLPDWNALASELCPMG